MDSVPDSPCKVSKDYGENTLTNAAVRRSLHNTTQHPATDKFTSHLRRKQDQQPIILNNFKRFNQKGKQTLFYILTTEARILHVFIVNIVHLILTLNVNQLL
jgi:hypothetical protein